MIDRVGVTEGIIATATSIKLIAMAGLAAVAIATVAPDLRWRQL